MHLSLILKFLTDLVINLFNNKIDCTIRLLDYIHFLTRVAIYAYFAPPFISKYLLYNRLFSRGANFHDAALLALA